MTDEEIRGLFRAYERLSPQARESVIPALCGILRAEKHTKFGRQLRVAISHSIDQAARLFDAPSRQDP